jgi:dTDP-4-dehydrorhamnose reductase
MADGGANILVLGASGMLGSALLRVLVGSQGYRAWGTVRAQSAGSHIPPSVRARLMCGVEADNVDALTRAIASVRADVVINCIGVVKQRTAAADPLVAIPINAVLPHRLARLCQSAGARLVHISTDCVFVGDKGMYTEDDAADARDLYGLSKYLGEVDYPHAITLRTSMIGQELTGGYGLISWFLAQRVPVRGFSRAIFSGLPTVELAGVIRDYVLPRPTLHGVYHVSSEPISKYALLRLVAETYGKQVVITADDQPVIDRSLDSRRFRELTGYLAPAWPELVRRMHAFEQAV